MRVEVRDVNLVRYRIQSDSLGVAGDVYNERLRLIGCAVDNGHAVTCGVHDVNLIRCRINGQSYGLNTTSVDVRGCVGGTVDYRNVVAAEVRHVNLVRHRVHCYGQRSGADADRCRNGLRLPHQRAKRESGDNQQCRKRGFSCARSLSSTELQAVSKIRRLRRMFIVSPLPARVGEHLHVFNLEVRKERASLLGLPKADRIGHTGAFLRKVDPLT